MKDNVVVPFKPFTLGEVVSITGIPFGSLDEMVRTGLLPLRKADADDTIGLDITACFAAFCAAAWQREGADAGKLIRLIEFINERGYDFLMQCVSDGFSMPSFELGVMVGTPRSRLGWALNFHKLNGDFRAALDRVFPAKTSVYVGPAADATETKN